MYGLEEPLVSPFREVVEEARKLLVEREPIVELLLTAILAGGHVLLEGYLGVAKTYTAMIFARLIGGKFKRIQCTPDILPSDILGSYIFDQRTGKFVLRKGPIFANVILVDELNRANPRTQSAFIEALQELRVSIEGTTLELPQPFIIVATRVTLIEEEGVYPVPRVFVDRFMFSVPIGEVTPEKEAEVLSRIDSIEALEVKQVVDPKTILKFRERAKRITVAPSVKDYIVRVRRTIYHSKDVLYPPSTRASISLYKGARVLALMHGRDYVVPDDVKKLIPYVFRHRTVLKPEAELRGVTVESILESVLEEVPVPR